MPTAPVELPRHIVVQILPTGPFVSASNACWINNRTSRVVAAQFLGGLAEILGVLQPNVCAKRFIQHLSRFWLRIPCISHSLFNADDLMALRAFAEAMTGTIHFFPGSKPTHVGQFWFFHVPSFPQVGELCQLEIQPALSFVLQPRLCAHRGQCIMKPT